VPDVTPEALRQQATRDLFCDHNTTCLLRAAADALERQEAELAKLRADLLEAEAIATRQMCQCPVGDGRAEHFPNCPVAIALKIRALRLAVPESPQAPPEEAARELP